VDGKVPNASLVLDKADSLHGTTVSGGANELAQAGAWSEFGERLSFLETARNACPAGWLILKVTAIFLQLVPRLEPISQILQPALPVMSEQIEERSLEKPSHRLPPQVADYNWPVE
jgi:hypothetical protein